MVSRIYFSDFICAICPPPPEVMLVIPAAHEAAPQCRAGGAGPAALCAGLWRCMGWHRVSDPQMRWITRSRGEEDPPGGWGGVRQISLLKRLGEAN